MDIGETELKQDCSIIAMQLLFLFCFSSDTEWAKVTVGVSVWKAKAVVPCPGWSCPSFHCVPPQATVSVVPQHLREISCRKRIQAQNTHLWSGYFNPDQVLDRVHHTTPRVIMPAQLKERRGTGEKQRDFGLQQAQLLPTETLIKLYQIFVLKQIWNIVSEHLQMKCV